MKYQQEFFKIYQTSSVQLRMIEQQRLLTISEHMRLTMNLTLNLRDHQRFSSHHFDDMLNLWDEQHHISLDHWSQFPRRLSLSRQEDSSLHLLDEIKQVIDQYYTSNIDSSLTARETTI